MIPPCRVEPQARVSDLQEAREAEEVADGSLVAKGGVTIPEHGRRRPGEDT